MINFVTILFEKINNLQKYDFYDIMYMARKIAYNKKRGTFDSTSECHL